MKTNGLESKVVKNKELAGSPVSREAGRPSSALDFAQFQSSENVNAAGFSRRA
jgi:hypothetical protein